MMVRVACIQTNTGPDIAENTRKICDAIDKAVVGGAEFILTPENSCHIITPSHRKRDTAMMEEDHILLKAACEKASQHRVAICLGSLTIRNLQGQLFNRSFMIGKDGRIITRYDKIHLFDVDLPNGEKHRESDVFTAGTRAVIADLADVKIGMSICYDIRFPHLYRDLAKAGAQILLIPAAFTVPTGRAHWEVLLRARAIETGCFVMAAAQTGRHDGGRQTWGHSMIISPWGDIMVQKEEDEDVIFADLDLSKVSSVQSAIPALQHDRTYTLDINAAS